MAESALAWAAQLAAAEEEVKEHRLQAHEAYMTYLELQNKVYEAEKDLVQLREQGPHGS